LAAERIRQRLKIHLKPEQFIVIGDTPNDIACAHHFGAKALAVGTGRLYTTNDLLECSPEAFIKDFSNLELVMQTIDSL
jgi:phosphoglycolate phosphatase-like HAD superfamily hydrolase